MSLRLLEQLLSFSSDTISGSEIFFPAWNGNSWKLGAFRGLDGSLCVILTNGNVLGSVDVNFHTATNTAAIDGPRANTVCYDVFLYKVLPM